METEKNYEFCSAEHEKEVRYYCKECDKYICQNCSMEKCYVHGEELIGLEVLVTEALAVYQPQSKKVEWGIEYGEKHIQENSVEKELDLINDSIDKSYERLLRAIDDHEECTLRQLREAPVIDQLNKANLEMTDEYMNRLRGLDRRLESEIKHMLGTVAEGNVMDVLNYTTYEKTMKDEEEVAPYKKYLGIHKEFLKHFNRLKTIDLDIRIQPRLLDSIIQIKGKFQRFLRLFAVNEGSNEVILHFPDIGVWKQIPLQLERMKVFPFHSAQVLHGNCLYVMGGKVEKRIVCKDVIRICYSERCEGECEISFPCELPEPRGNHSGIGVWKSIIIAGGGNNEGLLSSTHKYHTERKEWNKLPDIKQPRVDASLCAVDHTVYLIGGSNTHKQNLNTIEFLDILSPAPQWNSFIPQLSGPRSPDVQSIDWLGVKSPGTANIKGNILIFGGSGGEKELLDQTAILNLGTAEIRLETQKLKKETKFGGKMVLISDDRVMALGDKNFTLHHYSILTNQWKCLNQDGTFLK